MCVCVRACVRVVCMFVCVSGGDTATGSPGSSPPCAEEPEVDVEGVEGALRALHQELGDTQRDGVTPFTIQTPHQFT